MSNDLKENLKQLVSYYESMSIKDFNQIIEDVLLIIFYNFDKKTFNENVIEFYIESLKNQMINYIHLLTYLYHM